MPYESTFTAQATAPDLSGAVADHASVDPTFHLILWPHQSLQRIGFVGFIACTAVLSSLPLLAVLGTPALWGLLPFMLLALAAIWLALRRNHSDGALTEELAIWPDRMTLVRNGPRGARAEWSANPYWVQTAIHPTQGPVPDYLTLRGGDREVELGAFLSPAERIALRSDLDHALRDLRWVDALAALRTTTRCKVPSNQHTVSQR